MADGLHACVPRLVSERVLADQMSHSVVDRGGSLSVLAWHHVRDAVHLVLPPGARHHPRHLAIHLAGRLATNIRIREAGEKQGQNLLQLRLVLSVIH